MSSDLIYQPIKHSIAPYNATDFRSVNIIAADNIKDFEDVILDEYDDYDYTYVSVGSAYRESTFRLDGIDFNSNDQYQVLPEFLAVPEINLRLIMVDLLPENGLQVQIDRLRHHLRYTNATQITLFIYNHVCDEEFVMWLRDHLVATNTPPANFLICNFVQFKHPNNNEMNGRTQLLPMIHNLLGTEYNRQYYVWAGYTLLQIIIEYNVYAGLHGFATTIQPQDNAAHTRIYTKLLAHNPRAFSSKNAGVIANQMLKNYTGIDEDQLYQSILQFYSKCIDITGLCYGNYPESIFTTIREIVLD